MILTTLLLPFLSLHAKAMARTRMGGCMRVMNDYTLHSSIEAGADFAFTLLPAVSEFRLLFPMKRVNDAFPNVTSSFSLCRSPLCFSLCSFSIHECIVYVYSRIWVLRFCIFEGIDAEIKKTEESSSLIKLELGIAGCESVAHKNTVRLKQEKAESPFTAEQLQELYYQILVFNFIVYCLPVPFHLLLPNWKTVFHSDPSFTGFSNQNSDHGSMMDPEPERCRRTDGRKWRCSNNALPKEKYCERHMHRGRKCSRKHVEHCKSDPSDEILTPNITIMPSKTISDPNCETLTSNIRIKPISSSIPCDLDLTFSSSNPSNGVPAIKHGSNRNHDFIQPTIKACRHNIELNNNLNDDAYSAATITPTSASGKEAIGDISMKNRSNNSEGMDGGFNNVKARKVHIRNNNVCENNYAGSNTPAFGVSRDGVLQSGSGSRCVTLGLLKETLTEAEPRRCKRTDGKKWRCSKDVVLGQNYCNSHMHRGAKRMSLDSDLANGARSTPQSGCTSQAIPKFAYNSINLNAKPASPPEFTENKSTSSSDATTITDENVSSCNALAISP